ncbi:MULTISPECIES: response regulator [Nostoc]|uniref:histidine kinase n=1 Tax=Nostoc paludosum FACHB-159 TaxID=2692908 RepID=A0ABR8KEE0_9NOSO|nr:MULTISPECIES: response regulator [Nostoc]MBD2680710.1 response regulator [Nostoc sp. FACHB-857]MBD2737186.1 response regulator [Nostoc paludosum FACHB-159]
MKILIVEDDEFNAYALTSVLTNQNYAVEVAADGDIAWDFIQTCDFDLILLDVMLPKLDGISLCRKIRSHGLQVPILLLTGRDSGHEKAIGLDAGADDYVVKPFDQEELVARVRALLRRGTITLQPILERGNLRLNPSSCEVNYAGNLLALTPKEYALLELFLRNSQRVFSCGMILEHLWSYEDTPQEEAVRTHIKGLRHKLKAVGAPSDLIETVYGIGYRLKPLEEAEGKGAGGQGERETREKAGANAQRPILLYERLRQRLGSVQVPNAQSKQQTLMAVAEIWQRYQGRVDEQVKVLEQAIAALNENNLNPEFQSFAAKEAHTLAGSLGTFGLTLSSKWARNIELLLSSGQTLSRSQINNLETWVKFLRREIEEKNAAVISASPTTQVLETPTPTRENLSETETKILVVDDDPQIQALLQTLLSPWGLKAIALEDPRQFWETLEAVAPDLLILDLELPFTNGIELCQMVRNDPRWSELPIVFLTVHNDAKLVNQVFSVGADDFVSKPIIGPELVTRIVNRLERVKLRQRVAQRSRGSEGAGEEFLTPNSTVNSQQPTLNNFQAINELELRVAERTAELIAVNQQLQSQLNERQQTQEELRFSQARFARILDIADDAIISIDGFQCITLFNQGAEKIFGYSAQEVIGQKLDLLLPQRFCNVHRQHVVDFGKSPNLARRMGERREIYGRRKDGTEFPAEASISKIDLSREIFYTVILRDITERKQIERMKDEFISVVSHELRTPLTSIHGSLGMLASGLLPTDSEQGKRLLQIATDSTERLVRLINDILDIERIESGKAKMESTICNIIDIIAQAVNVMQPLADKAGVKLVISDVSGQVWADCDRIVQTLTNLLSNAIKFSSSGSTVCLQVQQQDDEVLLIVKDTGRGIPADKLESIFERFQQVDSSDSRNHDGTGLGLAICKSIMQQHGGRIWAESVLGEGSTFYVTLPLIRTSQKTDKSNQLNLVNKPFSDNHLLESLRQALAKSSKKVRVLIVEDDTDLAQLLMTLFERHKIETFLAKTGREAIRLSQEVNPDLMILDLILPESDGFAVVDWLQQHNYLCNTPVLVYSARDLDESEHNRLKLGHTEFLTKGRVSSEEFEQRVMELLQRVTHNQQEDSDDDNKANSSG